jgi:hypothetical protein
MVLASYPAGDPRASLIAARRATEERERHPDAHVIYNARRDDFEVVTSDQPAPADS